MHLSLPFSGLHSGKRAVSLAAALLLLGLLPGSASGQAEIRSRAMELTITGRLHSQFITSSVEDMDDEVLSSEFLIRRARVTVELEISDFVHGKIQPDYGGGDLSLKDAYVDLNFDPGFVFRMGQFKRRFDFFELESSTRNLVIERDGFIPGVDVCGGVGEICSFSRFTEKLEYSDRDIGFAINGEPEGAPISYSVAVTNGTGSDATDENDGKSFSGRFEVEAMDDLTLAGNVSAHDFVNDTTGDASDYAIAFGGDVNWGNYSEGLHVQAGVIAGDNWEKLDLDGDPATFVTAQGIVSYKVPVETNRFVEAVEPLGRISWGDPDTDTGDDEGILATPGVVVHFTGRNKFAVNADIYSPSAGDTEVSFKAQMYLHF